MSDLNNDLEALVSDMGMSISDEGPSLEQTNVEQTAEEQTVVEPEQTIQSEPEQQAERPCGAISGANGTT